MRTFLGDPLRVQGQHLVSLCLCHFLLLLFLKLQGCHLLLQNLLCSQSCICDSPRYSHYSCYSHDVAPLRDE